VDEQKEGLSITAHVALLETGGNPGGVGKKGREENKGNAGTSSDRLLSICSRGVL